MADEEYASTSFPEDSAESDAWEERKQPRKLTLEELGERARANRSTALDHLADIPPGARTIKALRDRRKVIE